MGFWENTLYMIPTSDSSGVGVELEDVEDVFRFGMEKHKGKGFQLGTVSVSEHYEALQRHLMKAFEIEENDDETGKSHWAHAMCRLLMIIYQLQNLRETDDRPIRNV